MDRVWPIALVLIWLVALSMEDGTAARPLPKPKPSPSSNASPVARFNNSGEIEGIVRCLDAASIQQPVEDTLVHIQGHSFMAKTGPGGEFTLHNVPAGSYTLVVEVPGPPANLTVTNPDQTTTTITVPTFRQAFPLPVEVSGRHVTDTGLVDACP